MKTVKHKLYNYEQTPPANVWEQISGQLDSGKIVPMLPARRRTKMRAFITAAAAVVILVVINFIYVKTQQHPKEQALASQSGQPGDSAKENYQLLESIIKAPQSQKLLAMHRAEETNNIKYFTIEGPGGEPVKISPKVATLIISADGEFPPKPVWNEKINHWQHIMLTNNAATASTSLIDIIQKASATME